MPRKRARFWNVRLAARAVHQSPTALESQVYCMNWAQKPAPLPPCGNCYICNLREWARAVHRVLRKDGVLFLNLGDSYFSGKSRYANTAGEWMRDKMLAGVPALAHQALLRDGWIVRSQIIWSKENAMPESSDDRPTTRHEVVLLAAKTADYWWDSDAIRRAYEITSIQRAGRDNSGQGKYSEWAHGQRPQSLALRAGPGKIRQCRRRGVANADARIPSQESTQMTRTLDQGGAGTGLQAWRVETDNRRKDSAEVVEKLNSHDSSVVSHPLGAVAGSVWTGATAQYKGSKECLHCGSLDFRLDAESRKNFAPVAKRKKSFITRLRQLGWWKNASSPVAPKKLAPPAERAGCECLGFWRTPGGARSRKKDFIGTR